MLRSTTLCIHNRLVLSILIGNIDDDTLVQLADSVHNMINERGVCVCVRVCVGLGTKGKGNYWDHPLKDVNTHALETLKVWPSFW